MQAIREYEGFNLGADFGFNEFVLYGENYKSEALEIENIPLYYLYTSLTWAHPDGGHIT